MIISQAKFLIDNLVTAAKIRLANNTYLRARNVAGDADVNLIKLNGSDVPEFAFLPVLTGVGNLATEDYVNSAVAPAVHAKENITLSGTDITNQYVDLSASIKLSSLVFVVDGLVQTEGTDYTVDLAGGDGGATRVTFAGDLATGGPAALIATDVIHLQYVY